MSGPSPLRPVDAASVILIDRSDDRFRVLVGKRPITRVSRAVENRPTLPVLGNILLATEDARLRLSATNLEMSITTWIGAKVDQEGAITLPASSSHARVGEL